MRDIFLASFNDMSIYQIIIWFFIYSFFGWCMECVVIRVQLKHWENRGFAKLPFCIIYGFGCMGALIAFAPFSSNIVALYFAGCIGGTAFEYAVALIMLRMFGKLWWNYDHKKINYKGILCLESTLAWGVICILMFKVVNVKIKNVIFMMDVHIVKYVSIILITAYVVDFAVQFYHSIKNRKHMECEN